MPETKKKAAETEEVDEVVVDVPDADDDSKIEMDLMSFNRAERSELQKKYGQNFNDLVNYVQRGCFGRGNGEQPSAMFSATGELIFADDVLVDMVMIARKRDPDGKPDVTDASFAELTDSFRLPKASRKTQSSSKT